MNTFHKVLFVLAILIANCISASAIEFTVDGVCYYVNSDNTTVTVAGYPSGSKPTGHLTIPESVTFRGLSFPVTSIGGYAFSGCTGLTSVTIGNSVTTIGKYAFRSCAGLTSVTIGNSVTSIGEGAFGYCSGLTSVTIPNSVTSIGKEAFYKCTGLTSVTIGNSVTSIGGYAFSGCSGLTSVTIGNSVTSIGDRTFWGCSGLTSVVWNAKNCSDFSYNSNPFKGLTNIKTFELGNEVERIPADLCYGLTHLTSVTIPNSVTSIGGYAFWGCSGLTSVTIGNSVTEIGGYAFSGCTGLTSVTIPNSVKLIGSNAFSGSNELTEVVWNAESCNINYTSESYNPFYGCPIMKLIIGDEVQQIPSCLMYKQIFLTSVTIGNSVTSIGEGAFGYCSGLTSVTIPNSVTTIGEKAFEGCNRLTSIKVESGNSVYDSRENCNAIIETAKNILISGCKNTIIPNSVTSIGSWAFCECSGLTSVTIPNSVISIGSWAFCECIYNHRTTKTNQKYPSVNL